MLFAVFSGVHDWIVLILVWIERSLHSAHVSGQSCPWPLKLVMWQAVEGTWFYTGGYRRLRDEWVNNVKFWIHLSGAKKQKPSVQIDGNKHESSKYHQPLLTPPLGGMSRGWNIPLKYWLTRKLCSHILLNCDFLKLERRWQVRRVKKTNLRVANSTISYWFHPWVGWLGNQKLHLEYLLNRKLCNKILLNC